MSKEKEQLPLSLQLATMPPRMHFPVGVCLFFLSGLLPCHPLFSAHAARDVPSERPSSLSAPRRRYIQGIQDAPSLVTTSEALLEVLAAIPQVQESGAPKDKDRARALASAAVRAAPHDPAAWLALGRLEDSLASPWRAVRPYALAVALQLETDTETTTGAGTTTGTAGPGQNASPRTRASRNRSGGGAALRLLQERMLFMAEAVEPDEWAQTLARLQQLRAALLRAGYAGARHLPDVTRDVQQTAVAARQQGTPQEFLDDVWASGNAGETVLDTVLLAPAAAAAPPIDTASNAGDDDEDESMRACNAADASPAAGCDAESLAAASRRGSALPALPRRLPLRALWATPLLHSNLVTLGLLTEPELATFNTAVTALVNAKHTALRAYLRQQAGGRGDVRLAEVNDLFFMWQMRGLAAGNRLTQQAHCTGWAELGAVPGFAKLCSGVRAVVRQAAEQTGMQVGLGGAEELYAWASLHRRGSRHGAHTHGDSAWSAVYYTHVPAGAGRLRFHDPRAGIHGDRPPEAPFLHGYEITPRAGDLVVFPSWLRHEVLQSGGAAGENSSEHEDEDGRVSVAFNLLGYWDDPADVMGGWRAEAED